MILQSGIDKLRNFLKDNVTKIIINNDIGSIRDVAISFTIDNDKIRIVGTYQLDEYNITITTFQLLFSDNVVFADINIADITKNSNEIVNFVYTLQLEEI